jgi:excinuclease ABC subunit C
MDQALKEKLGRLPEAPGVYLMKDAKADVIYVGKAANLRSRVRSYFSRGDGRAFVSLLDDLLADLEVVVTRNEKEALLLENELIKRHKPRFNVMLRDDKSFICLRLDTKHEWPRLEIVRAHGLRTDGALYFGPYASASSIRETLRVVNRHFQLRICSDSVLYNRKRPCILYQIKRCPAPCVYDVSRDDYAQSVRETVMFLQGKEVELVDRLRERMTTASSEMKFEEAARVRDQLFAVERSLERQRTVLSKEVDEDAFGFFREADHILFYVLHVRAGRMVGGRGFPFSGQEFPDDELLSSFVGLYYDGGNLIPDVVLLPMPIEDAPAKADWLTEKRGRRVKVQAPKSGAGADLVTMARENARTSFADHRRSREEVAAIAERLRQRLGLQRVPKRMECYDISNLQGDAVVASGVAFLDGEPDKDRYRHYHVKGVDGQNDFAAMYEVLSRRAKRGLVENDLPDLFVIDGGKGQLGAAMAALKDAGVSGVDAVGLAKSRVIDRGRRESVERSPERVFVPGRKDPIVLRQNSPELFWLARIRDEAHRFAITFHRRQRTARNFRSELDAVSGIGAERKKALLRRFGSLQGVRKATQEEIAEVAGFGPHLAAQVYAALHSAERELKA